MAGKLYVVATPIGNLSDMSERAVKALTDADFIAVEDSRVTAVLLNRFGIKKRMVSYHKFNERERSESLIQAILDGADAALVSDAGTPCISDPGYIFVESAVKARIEVIAVCGPCAAVTALSVSGFNIKSFAFYGFPPRKASEITALLDRIKDDSQEICVFYESPQRIIDTLAKISGAFPKSEICLCNDLSKKFERIYRGSPDGVISELTENPDAGKGEYTLVILKNYERMEDDGTPEAISVEAGLVDIMVKKGCTLKEAVGIYASENKGSITKKNVYDSSLNLKDMLQ